jgi:hypothetical protein
VFYNVKVPDPKEMVTRLNAVAAAILDCLLAMMKIGKKGWWMLLQ